MTNAKDATVTEPWQTAPRGRGQSVFYMRVSSTDQNEARQYQGLTAANGLPDRSFIDQASGRDTARPELAAMRLYVREGDTLAVYSMDRLARNVDDLRRLVAELTGRGVRVQFIREALTFTGEDSPMANLLLSVLGAVAQFERDLIRERQREGIALAKTRGVYKGRPPSLSAERREELTARMRAGESRAALAREFKISRQHVYRLAAAGGVSSAERSSAH
jgi:DNA invertase Pin-like site-specific DNA recombinase